MKYTDKFKLKCVLNYQNGKKIKAPCSVGKKIFMTYVKRWIKLYKDLGEEGLKHNSKNKNWTTKERFKLVSKYIKGKSINSISLKNHINPG
ncbi:helix-turn-helix domain-containing protein, partial [[Mycoplasma] testudinis]|uniref:helix-turn-helix domain-containing protein n=1 Tax=[Mycoplasma] testudinis TaxID=33924 RepID=UPI000482C4B8